MSIKRKVLAAALRMGGFARMMAAWRGLTDRNVLILAYHRVLDIDSLGVFDFDRNLISATPADFEWQMKYITANFNPISFDQLIQSLDNGSRLPPKPVVVTFDDGYDDNANLAFPILHRLGVPATMFVATGHVDSAQPFWFDWVVFLVKHAHVHGFDVSWSDEGPVLTDFNSCAVPSCAEDELLRHLKAIPDSLRNKYVKELTERLGVDSLKHGYEQSRAMTKAQIRYLAEAGIEFGSHTVTHPILTNTTDKQLKVELEISRQMLFDWTGKSANVIAYPNGDEASFDERVIQEAKRVGYRLGLSYIEGVNPWPPQDSELFRLRRLHVELDVSRSEFAAMLAWPSLFAFR